MSQRTASEAEPWAPLDASAHPSVRARLEGAVQTWSDHWFARARLGLASFGAATRAPSIGADRPVWMRHGRGVCVGGSRQSHDRLARLALSGPEDLPATSADRVILERLDAAICADLAARVEQALGLTPDADAAAEIVQDPFGGRGGAVAALAEEGRGPLVWIAAPANLTVGALRASLGPARPMGRPLASRASAVGRRKVSLQAVLGKTEISLADLKDLAPGDILVLDTPLSDGGSARLVGGGATLAHGGLSEVEGHKALIVRPTTQ